MIDFFDKFKDLEMQKDAGIGLVKTLSPELVVITYEILDFVKLKDINDYNRCLEIDKKKKELGEDYSKNEDKINKLYQEKNKLITLEHKSPTPKLLLYSALDFVLDGGGPKDYEPDGGQEDKISDCMNYLHQRINDDFNDEVDSASVREIILFSGLHGRFNPLSIANSLVNDFDLTDKVKIYSTGGYLDRNRKNARGVEVFDKEREDIVDKINPLLDKSYLECKNRFEQGMLNLDVLE